MSRQKEETRSTGQMIPLGGNKWRVRIFVGRDSNGKRKYSSKTINGSKGDAGKYLRAKLKEKEQGTYVEPTRELLDQYLDRWLEKSVKPRVRTRTYDDYAALLKRYIRGPLGALRLSSVRTADIQQVYESMSKRGLSPRVIRYTHQVLCSAFKKAVKGSILMRNPAATDLMDLPRAEFNEMQVLTPAQQETFLSTLEGMRHEALFTFALATGMRPEEYFALKWTDLNLVKGRATVQRALVRRQKGGGWYFAEPKTKGSRRTITFPVEMLPLLASHKRTQCEERLIAGAKWQDHGLVFTTSIGTPHHHSSLTSEWFKPALVKAGLPTVRLYDLRHSHATALLSAGVQVKIVSERLGHSTITLTLNTYAHVLPDMQQEASDCIGKLLFSVTA
jgi:integrase